MEKLKMHSLDNVDENIKKIGKLFPNCITEAKNDEGEIEYAIDFDKLKQELSNEVVEGNQERYQFTWPDKKKSMLLANIPIAKTLRPCKEESVDFDNTENLYIEGDNLEVLKLLQETYLGKIKMIYIDPPYNTGNDFVYEDNFSQKSSDYLENSGQFDEEGNRLVKNLESNGRFHTDWLNMMYPRLKLARNLLTEDGIIFISIAGKEEVNLQKLCNDIFGEGNYISKFIWEKKKKPSFLKTNVANKYESILCYSKNNGDSFPLSIELTETGKKYPINNAGNGIKDLVFPSKSCSFNMTDQIIKAQDMSEGRIKTELLNDVEIENGYNKNDFILRGEWRYSQNKIFEIIKNKEEILISKIPFRPNHIKKGGEIKKMHDLLTIALYKVKTYEDADKEQIQVFGKENIFSYSKPSDLIKLLIKSCTYNDNDAIVLDFFSGSATAAHAVMQLNAEDEGTRKFILVQLPEETDRDSEAYNAGYKNICEIGKERIRRTGKQIKEENPLTTQDLDIGFRVLKCDSTNMKDVYYKPEEYEEGLFDSLKDNIKEDRTSEDLLFQVMLDLGVLLSSQIEESTIDNKKIFNVADGYLIACFDENITEDIIIEIAKQKPYYFVMRDSSLAVDNVLTNFDQIFATYSPDTIRKVL